MDDVSVFVHYYSPAALLSQRLKSVLGVHVLF